MFAMVYPFTSTTPPRSHNRLTVLMQPDPESMALRASHEVMALPFAISPHAVVFDKGRMDGPQREVLEQMTLKRDADAVRLLHLWELLPCVSLDTAGARWKADSGTDKWSVDMVFGGGTIVSCKQEAVLQSQFKAASEAVRTDPTRIRQIKIQEEAPYVGLLVALNVLNVRPWPEFTLLLTDIVVFFLAAITHRLKFQLAVPRPYETEMGGPTNTLIDKPAYESFPGGHAAGMAALAEVLIAVTGASEAEANRFRPMAKLIACDRERAGIHTCLDTDSGLALGKAMGEGLVKLGRAPWGGGPMGWQALFMAAQLEWAMASPGGA